MTGNDDALAWLEIAVKGPMEPIAAGIRAFDESFSHVLLVPCDTARNGRHGHRVPGTGVEGPERLQHDHQTVAIIRLGGPPSPTRAASLRFSSRLSRTPAGDGPAPGR